VQAGGTPSQTPLLLHVRELEPPVMENPLSHWYVSSGKKLFDGQDETIL
jgi:hypothetical protein